MLSDLRHAFRQLWKSKGVTAAVALSLALCIGANAVIFSMLYAVVLRPLPFDRPEQLVEIYNSYPKLGVANSRSNIVQYIDYAKHPEVFAGLALFKTGGSPVGDSSGATQMSVARVTPGFFGMLGVTPILGQFFSPDSSTPGNEHFVVLSYPFWKAHFGGDPKVLGEKMTVSDLPCTIIGVAPASVQYFAPGVALYAPQTWLPQWFDELDRQSKDVRFVRQLFARLRPGMTLPQAAARIDAIDRGYYETASATYRRYVDESGAKSIARPLRNDQALDQKGTLLLLQCAALFVLLIGCVNVANLLLARATGRQAEIAIRHALGGSHWQIVRQLLTESLLLSILGGGLGIALAAAGTSLANKYSLSILGNRAQFQIDISMFAFALSLSAAVGILTGALPAIRVLRGNLLAGIQQSSRNASLSRRSRTLGSLLASGQIALSLILLVGTGLLVRSLAQALAVAPGFNAVSVTTARIALAPKRFSDPAVPRKLLNRVLESLGQIPGVEAVGLASNTPMQGGYQLANVFIHGAGSGVETAHPVADWFSVSPGYFDALEIPILRGRAFDARDDSPRAQSIVVDRRFAELYLAGGNPLGRRIALDRLPAKDTDWLTIIGVVETVHYNGLDDAKGVPFFYLPISQYSSLGNSFLLRSRRTSRDLVPLIRERVQAIDPGIPVYSSGSMEDFVGATLDNRRSLLSLLGIFATIALALSGVGIYGVLAYDVSQRTREIGIRGAIGATPQQILGLVLSQGLRTIALGMGVGLAGALLLGRVMGGLLFQVAPYDPTTLGIISALLFSIGLVASLLPAWRAAQIDPVVALRTD